MKKFYILGILSLLFGCSEPLNFDDKKAPQKWKDNATIYELNVRQFSEKGDFSSILPHLERIRKMGIKIIWLMPIHPIGEKNRKGSLGSYYSVKNYKAINPEFGSEEEFKQLVDSIHALDMKIIIDWVPNHSAFDNPWANEHKEWYTLDSNQNLQPPLGTDWWDVADLNYDNSEMRMAMIDALLYWVNEFNIDGYRCDVASWVPDDFWADAIDTLRTAKDVFMLAEAEGKNMHDAGFDMTYNWSYMHVTNEIAKGKKSLLALDSLLLVEDSLYENSNIRMYFTTNHDENSWNGTTKERYGSSFEVQTLLAFTMPGMPLLYNGQESSLNKRLRFFEKDTIVWGDYNMERYYSKLLQLRTSNSAMWSNDSTHIFSRLFKDHENLYAFQRKNNQDEVNVFLNFGKDTILLNNINLKGKYIDLMNNKTLINLQDISILPEQGKVFIKQ